MPFTGATCICKSEAALTEAFGPPPERPEREPPPHWRDQVKEAWATWGSESDEFQKQLQRFGDSGRIVQELGYKLEQATGLKPLWNTPKKVKWWSTGLWELYEEAGYSIPVAIEAAKALKEKGAVKVYASCTHAVLSGPALERLNSSAIEEVIVTNTISLHEKQKECPKIKAISIAPMIAEAIKRIHEESSISSLFT